MFNDELHNMTLSEDGSYTAYSKEYAEHYHSTRDGALHESLVKHVLPALEMKKNQDEITILDICYGLGFNTLATILYHKEHNLKAKLNIYSPELDANLVNSLVDFPYPKAFEPLKEIIETLSREGVYENDTLYVEVYLGDARAYIKNFSNKFDIVYQDAFSPSVNPMLWTREYFKDIKNGIKEEGILTTYSISLATRLALFENDFIVYLNIGEDYRDATIASLSLLDNYKRVDMLHKISCNPHAKSLRD